MKSLKKVLAVAVAVLAGVVMVQIVLPVARLEKEERSWKPLEFICYFKYLR